MTEMKEALKRIEERKDLCHEQTVQEQYSNHLVARDED